MLRRDGAIEERIDMTRIARNRGLRRRQCIVVAVKQREYGALIGEGGGITGVQLERLVIARKRPLMAAERRELVAAIEMGGREIGPRRQRLLAAWPCLLRTAKV